jgi:hypothetical protein
MAGPCFQTEAGRAALAAFRSLERRVSDRRVGDRRQQAPGDLAGDASVCSEVGQPGNLLSGRTGATDTSRGNGAPAQPSPRRSPCLARCVAVADVEQRGQTGGTAPSRVCGTVPLSDAGPRSIWRRASRLDPATDLLLACGDDAPRVLAAPGRRETRSAGSQRCAGTRPASAPAGHAPRSLPPTLSSVSTRLGGAQDIPEHTRAADTPLCGSA